MEQDILSTHYKMWTREATTILIHQYEVHECMWMTTSPFYRNKQKRSEALVDIAVAVSRLRPQTSAEDIKNKINGIRTQYVSEINKLIISSNRGEKYEPTLWCFDMLEFLKPFTQPKQKSINRDWYCNYMPKPYRSKFAQPPKPQSSIQPPPQPKPQEPHQSSEASQSNKNFIIIKEEDNDVEIIEEEDTLQTDDDYSSHSSHLHDQEDKSYKEAQEETNQNAPITPVKEATPPPPNIDSGYEDQEDTNRVRKLFSPSGIGAEITLVPKKSLVKRKSEDVNEINHVDDKKKKIDAETNTEYKDDELENRINIFGRFVMSQMKIIKDKVLLLKLEHTIQNAIIGAQLKQIQFDESKKNNDNRNQN